MCPFYVLFIFPRSETRKIELHRALLRARYRLIPSMTLVSASNSFVCVNAPERRGLRCLSRLQQKIFVISSLGTTIHLNIYYTGMEYTSATVATALSNVIPCLTFLIAVLLR